MHTEGRPRKDIGEGGRLQAKERGRRRNQPRGQHDLGLPASRSWDNKCLRLNHPVCGPLLQQSWQVDTSVFQGFSVQTSFNSASPLSTVLSYSAAVSHTCPSLLNQPVCPRNRVLTLHSSDSQIDIPTCFSNTLDSRGRQNQRHESRNGGTFWRCCWILVTGPKEQELPKHYYKPSSSRPNVMLPIPNNWN